MFIFLSLTTSCYEWMTLYFVWAALITQLNVRNMSSYLSLKHQPTTKQYCLSTRNGHKSPVYQLDMHLLFCVCHVQRIGNFELRPKNFSNEANWCLQVTTSVDSLFKHLYLILFHHIILKDPEQLQSRCHIIIVLGLLIEHEEICVEKV